LGAIAGRARRRRKKVVFTNGCFDILHYGHVKLLNDAKKLGDLLIVGINSDASIRRLKGPGRPVNSQEERALILASLIFVDYVGIFNEMTPRNIIAALKPDVLVKGGDWKADKIIGADFVIARGGKVARIPLVKGCSSSAIIRKINSRTR